jgi:hypothetical protein
MKKHEYAQIMGLCEEAIDWSDLADLTHATQVEKFNFCPCEDNDGNDNPYDDCPTGVTA